MGWTQTYGGAGDDLAHSVIQTIDGGYAIVGRTESYGAGLEDFWLIKTDSVGHMQWNFTYGGTESDEALSLVQTFDGGYAIAGITRSVGTDSGESWLVKTDAGGDLEWSQTYGGKNGDRAYSMVQTADGGYALAGYTESFGAGLRDFWLIRTDVSGNHVWNKTYGGVNDDVAYSVVQTTDERYVLAGYTDSFGAGSWDFWLIRTDTLGNHVWNKTHGGVSPDDAHCVVQTSYGGYALAGYTSSFGAGGGSDSTVKAKCLVVSPSLTVIT